MSAGRRIRHAVSMLRMEPTVYPSRSLHYIIYSWPGRLHCVALRYHASDVLFYYYSQFVVLRD